MRIGMLAACLVAFAGVVIYFGLSAWLRMDSRGKKEEEARKQLAFVSLLERLPKGKPIPPGKPLDAKAKERWENLDRNLALEQDHRAKLLKAFHDKTREFFVESEGAGPERRLVPPEMILLDNWRAANDADQPGQAADFPNSPGETLTRVQPSGVFHLDHERGMLDFLYPAGFGYVKDRTQVAGFKPHGFRELTVSDHESKRWRVYHVQLIGILSHPEPVVYLTDKLPSMEQVRQGKTRALDPFEEAALLSLREGEDLHIVQKGDTLRMLGALRATKTCQPCHDAHIGDLLGALSYTLRQHH